MSERKNSGPAKYGAQRQLFIKNRKIILATQDICALCGKPVDKTLKKGDPYAPEVDHIIPWDVSKDCSLENLQLTHAVCNRQKSNKILQKNAGKQKSKKSEQKSDEILGKNGEINNRILPLSFNWLNLQEKV